MSSGKKLFLKIFIAVYIVVMVGVLVFGNMKMDLKASEYTLFVTRVVDGKTEVVLKPDSKDDPMIAGPLSALKEIKLAKDYVWEGAGKLDLAAGSSFNPLKKKLAEAVNGGAPNKAWITGSANVVGFDMTLILIALNFVGLLAILRVLLWDPILKALDNRAEGIRTELETARSTRTQADELLVKYNTQLDDAREQRQKLINDGRSEGEQERERIVAEARDEAQQALDRGRGEIDAELNGARATLKREVGAMAVGLAERILRREINETDQSQLVETFLGELEKEEQAKKK